MRLWLQPRLHWAHALVVCALLAACSREPASPESSVRRITVSVAPTIVYAGNTVQGTARAVDEAARPVEIDQFTWSSSAPSIARVDQNGVVTALTVGSATIRASVGTVVGQLDVQVLEPAIATLAITPDTASVLLPAGTLQLGVNARDATGILLQNPTLLWQSSAPRFATVTPTGQVRGVAAGEATISAQGQGITATARVTVRAPASVTGPRITSVSPIPLVPGSAATIVGTGFAAIATGNAVLIDGVPVTVNAASATSLTVTLPATGFACEPSRSVPVQITVGTELGVGSATLQSAAQRSLQPGQSVMLATAAEARCNELAANGGRYLLSVYNAARVMATGGSGVTLRGATATAVSAASIGALGAAPAPVVEAPRIGSPRWAGLTMLDRDREREQAHRAVLDFNRATFQRLGSPLSWWRVERARPRLQLGPTLAQQVNTPGAITPLKIPNLDTPNACSQSIAIGARTVYVGTRTIVVEDTISTLNGQPTTRGQVDSLLRALGDEFDRVGWGIDSATFGNPLALDGQLQNLGKVVMVYSPRINTLVGGRIIGFVVNCDFYPTSAAPSSNQGSFFYAFTPTGFTSGLGATNTQDWYRLIRATVVHEVKHIVSFGERIARNASLEDPFIEEGSARIAEELYARAVQGLAAKGNITYAQSVFCEVRPTDPTCGGVPIMMRRHVDNLYRFSEQAALLSAIGPQNANDAT
ncbi:MAG: Ig-like domain-containing protein, partial [Gemmatimonadaceae bacterium]|nr:Ig-like domain-containing protein [Gemmatimonadaceae bacterium]